MNAETMVGESPQETQDEIAWPPGLAGDIANYLYHAAPRPNREAAIAGALGLLAGINGRGYSVSAPPTGLNLYVALVMWSAIGKEAIHKIAYLHKRAFEKIECSLDDNEKNVARGMVHASKAASEPGLKQQLARTPGYVNTLSELGRQLHEMANANTQSPQFGLRGLFLELYDKSGPHGVIGGISYSKSENDIAPLVGPSFSVVGETTPQTFYDSLTSQAAADGFQSRWTVIERKSPVRPPANDHVLTEPTPQLLWALGNMIRAATKLSTHEQWQAVPPNPFADLMLKKFRDECDGEINKTLDHLQRAIWNRSHLKVLRTAALFAVADFFGGYICDIEIDLDHAEWAIQLERRNIAAVLDRMSSGDVGNDDHARQTKLLAILGEYVSGMDAAGKPVAIPEQCGQYRMMNMVPDQYLQNRTVRVAAFTSHKQGANAALKATVAALIDAGILSEVPTTRLLEGFKKKARAYSINLTVARSETEANGTVNAWVEFLEQQARRAQGTS